MTPLEALSQENDWLRRVAGAIARDDAIADDLVQETYLAAAQTPPTDSSRLRAWGRSVMTNGLRQRYRAETRRRRREEECARGERDEPHCQVSIAEARELIRAAVADLPEPLRDVIVLRYGHGMTPTEIAAQQGVTVDSVKSRLRRAREQLRNKLEQHFPGGAWTIAIAPLLGRTESANAVAAGTTQAAGGFRAVWIIAALTSCVLLSTVALSPDRTRVDSEPDQAMSSGQDPVRAPNTITSPTADEATPAHGPSEGRNSSGVPVTEQGSLPVVGDQNSSDKRVAVHGTLQVLNDPDSDAQRERARFVATPLDGQGRPIGAPRECVVVDGTWEISIAEGATELRIEDLQIGKRRAYVAGHKCPIPDNHDVDLIAFWYTPRTLSVSGIDGEPITNARVVAGDHLTREPPLCGIGRVELASGGPTITLPDHAAGRLWVHAPGYAWQLLDLEHAEPGRESIELARGGDLTIDCTIQGSAGGLDLAVFRQGAGARVGVVPVAPHVSLVGLRPGHYVVKAGVAPHFSAGTTAVEITTGTTTHAKLEINCEVPLVRVEGQVQIPEDFVEGLQLLTIHDADEDAATDFIGPAGKIFDRRRALSVDELKSSDDDSTIYHFETWLAPGDYRFRLDSMQLPGVYSVQLGDDAPIELRLPRLADVVLTVDEQNGQIADVEWVVWACDYAEKSRPVAVHSVRRRPTDTEFRFRAPIGTLRIAALRGPAVGRFEIRAGENVLRLTVESPGG